MDAFDVMMAALRFNETINTWAWKSLLDDDL